LDELLLFLIELKKPHHLAGKENRKTCGVEQPNLSLSISTPQSARLPFPLLQK